MKTVVTACPHCFNTLKNEYPAFGAQYDVVHHTTFIADLIKDGKLKPQKNNETGEVTFHDSCYLGRWNDVYSDPREILAAVPELKVIEMKRTKNKGLCCGAGGARMFMEEKIGNVAAGGLLAFFLEEIAPSVYNQAVADAQERLQARVTELDIEVHEDEFQYWRKFDRQRAGKK